MEENFGSLKSFIIDIPDLKKNYNASDGATNSIILPQISYSPKSFITIGSRKIFSSSKIKLGQKTKSKNFDFKGKIKKLKNLSVETRIRNDCMLRKKLKNLSVETEIRHDCMLRRKHELIRSMRSNLRNNTVKKFDYSVENRKFARLMADDSIKTISQLPSPKIYTPQLFSPTQAKRINMLNLRNYWIYKRVN